MKKNNKKAKYEQYSLTLYTNLNMRCNMRCSYCYEKGKYAEKPLSEEAFNKTYEFIKITPISSIVLMGGEVLLEKEKLIKILELIKIKNKENIYHNKMHVTIITNGTIYIEELKNYKDIIGVLQITHDGATHDINRKFIYGGSTSDLILKNAEKYKKDGFNIIFHSVLSISSYKDFLLKAPEFFNKFNASSLKNTRWALALQLVTSKEDLKKEKWSLRKINELYKELYLLINKYPFISIAGLSANDSRPCGVGSTLLTLNGETGEVFGCENQPTIDSSKYSFLGKVGNINSSTVIDQELVEKSIINNKYLNFRYQYVPKFISQILLKAYPLSICPTENYIYCNNSKVIPLFRLITSFYLKKIRALKKELGYDIY